MKKILEMRQKRAKAWDAAKAFLDARTKDGLLSAEDNAAYDRMLEEVDAMAHQIAIEEDRVARDAALAQPTSAPVIEKPYAQNGGAVTPRATAEYREDFGRALRGKPLLHNVMSEGVDADGGFLVPEEFERQMVAGLEETNIIRTLAKVISTSAERKIPVAATHSAAQWTPENAAYTESNPTFAQKTIDAFKLTDLAKVSIELLQDSMFDLESYIANEFSRAFGVAEEEAFCIGSGSGQPTGIFTASGGTVGVTAGSPTAITVDNLIDLIYALKSPYRRNAVFLMRDVTVVSALLMRTGCPRAGCCRRGARRRCPAPCRRRARRAGSFRGWPAASTRPGAQSRAPRRHPATASQTTRSVTRRAPSARRGPRRARTRTRPVPSRRR